VTFAGKFRMQS